MKRARASAQGRRTVWYWTSGATLGYRVQVIVRVSRKDRKGWCSTWFTPRAGSGGPPPSPTATSTSSPSPSPEPTHTSPPPSGAWCTATATVYDASRDWNDVYVNSNQPDTPVTGDCGRVLPYLGDRQLWLRGRLPGRAAARRADHGHGRRGDLHHERLTREPELRSPCLRAFQ
jgi:hypothetical protein